MAVSELINLIELLRSLASRKSQLDKDYVENFIEPVWISFSKVHEDYKKSLSEYGAMLSNVEIEISTIVDKIRKDSVFTDDLRAELYALTKNVPSPLSQTNRRYVTAFMDSILIYLTYRNLYESVTDNDRTELERFTKEWRRFGAHQHIRIPLVVYLSRKGNETNRKQAQQMYMLVLQELQDMYSNISNAYQRLRSQLLK